MYSGQFTAPHAGVYLITFSYRGYNDPSEWTSAYIHKDGERLGETHHITSNREGGSGVTRSTAGRAVYQRLEAGDTITLQTGTMTGDMYRIIMCVEFRNN